jgi:hypothetical protein
MRELKAEEYLQVSGGGRRKNHCGGGHGSNHGSSHGSSHGSGQDGNGGGGGTDPAAVCAASGGTWDAGSGVCILP